MSAQEGGKSRSVGAFLLGFLAGVLVCLVVGGGFFVVQSRQMQIRALEAEMVARMEAERAMAALQEAKAAREKAEQKEKAAR